MQGFLVKYKEKAGKRAIKNSIKGDIKMEKIESLEKANKIIELLEQEIKEYQKMLIPDNKIAISTRSVIRQMSSSDLLDELMRRENSKEELEKIALGFMMKKIGLNERVIEEVFQYISDNGVKRPFEDAEK